MKIHFAFLVRISILFLSLSCFAIPVQADSSSLQITSTVLVSTNVSFYQQQLEKLNYSVMKDGSFGPRQSKSLSMFPKRDRQAQLGADINSDPILGKRQPNQVEEVGQAEDKRTIVNGGASQILLPQIGPERTQKGGRLVQPSVETADHTNFSEQSESFFEKLGKTVRLDNLFQGRLRTRSSRQDPYVILNAVRENRRSMQPTQPLLSVLRKRPQYFDAVWDQQREQGTTVMRRPSKTQLYKNARKLKSQLERKFLFEDLEVVNMPTALLSRVGSNANQAKAAVSARIRAQAKSLLKEIESKASEAAESM